MVYKALGETLRMNFVVAFLELWLRMISLELWLRMISLELWLEYWVNTWHSLSCGSSLRGLPV